MIDCGRKSGSSYLDIERVSHSRIVNLPACLPAKITRLRMWLV